MVKTGVPAVGEYAGHQTGISGPGLAPGAGGDEELGGPLLLVLDQISVVLALKSE